MKIQYDTFHSHSKAETVISKSDIGDVFESIYNTMTSKMQKSLGKGSGWIIDSVIEHNISISKYNLLFGSSYIKLRKELDHPRKGLINIQNIDDNECFEWSLVRYLNHADHHLARTTKNWQRFCQKAWFKHKKFPVKIRDIHRIEEKNSISISVFSCENKEKHPISVSKKCCEEKHVDFLVTGEEGKRHYVVIKDFNTFMYDHSLHCEKKHFCRYCLQDFSTEGISKRHIKDCFKINGKQRIIMPKKGENFKIKNYEKKMKSPFIIYADFESILVPEDNGK